MKIEDGGRFVTGLPVYLTLSHFHSFEKNDIENIHLSYHKIIIGLHSGEFLGEMEAFVVNPARIVSDVIGE